MSKRKVIYIMGLDRSGSTILGVMLGNHDAIAHFGELQFYPKAVLNNRIVNNDHLINEIPFWKEVKEQFVGEFGTDVFHDFFRLKNKFERWRNLPILLIYFLIRHPQLKQYWAYNIFLADALLAKSAKGTLCDSSKNVMRRLALGLSGAFNLKTIFLLRDVRGYCWSHKKRSPLSLSSKVIWKATIKWIANNLLFALIAFFGNFLKIKYESIYQDHALSFKKIGKKVNLDLSNLSLLIKLEQPIKVINVIAGNLGVRHSKKVIPKLDVAWEKKLTEKEKKGILFLARWLLFLFGYEPLHS